MTAIVQNEGNTHIQARRSGVETTQPSDSARRTFNPYIISPRGYGFRVRTTHSNVARRCAFETMALRTARDVHIVLRAQQLGCETAILRDA